MVQKATPRQRLAIEALLIGDTVIAAAEKAKVTRGTVHRWMLQPRFKTALTQAESAALAALSRRLVKLADDSATVIEDTLAGADDANVKLRAVGLTWTALLKMRELVSDSERMDEIERRLAEHDRQK